MCSVPPLYFCDRFTGAGIGGVKIWVFWERSPVSWEGARRAKKGQHKILQDRPRRKTTVPKEKVGSGQKSRFGAVKNEASATPPAPLLATPPNSILGLVAFQRAYAGDEASWCYRRVKRAGCGVLASQVMSICTGERRGRSPSSELSSELTASCPRGPRLRGGGRTIRSRPRTIRCIAYEGGACCCCAAMAPLTVASVLARRASISSEVNWSEGKPGAWVRGCVRGWVRGCVGAWVRACLRACVRAWVPASSDLPLNN